MNRKLLGPLALLFSFILGISVSFLVRIQTVQESICPVVIDAAPTKCPSASDLIERGKYVVISLPSDNEFYIGKSSVALSEISATVRDLTASESPNERIVFIKGVPAVNYETVSSVIREVRDADVSRIEIVPNKKRVK